MMLKENSSNIEIKVIKLTRDIKVWIGHPPRMMLYPKGTEFTRYHHLRGGAVMINDEDAALRLDKEDYERN